MRRVRILAQAAEEAIEAAAWYEQERVGLGTEFAQAIDAAFDLLAADIVPVTKLYDQAGVEGIKRLVLRRFPYDIVVRETPEEIIVLAIAHQSRRPGYWRSRSGEQD